MSIRVKTVERNLEAYVKWDERFCGWLIDGERPQWGPSKITDVHLCTVQQMKRSVAVLCEEI